MDEKIDIFTMYKKWMKGHLHGSEIKTWRYGRYGQEFNDIIEYLYAHHQRFNRYEQLDYHFIDKIISENRRNFLDIWDATIEHINDPQRKEFLEDDNINWLEYYYSLANWITHNIGKLNTYHGDVCNNPCMWFWIMMDNLALYSCRPYTPFHTEDPEGYCIDYPQNSGVYVRACIWITLDPHKFIEKGIDSVDYKSHICAKIANESTIS